MNGLYPIIRRARRPLVTEDGGAGPPALRPPVPLVPPQEPVNYVKNKPKGQKDADVSDNQPKK